MKFTKFHSHIRRAGTAWICALCIHTGFAQSPGTPIDIQGAAVTGEERQRLVDEVLRLRDEGKIVSHEEIMRQLDEPEPEPVSLPAPSTKVLPTAGIAARARAANLRVGYVYLCQRCDEWHLNLAGGYAITEDVIVTCEHLVNTSRSMREGYLVAMDQDGRVAAAVAILARSAAMDTAVVKMAGAKFTPVPLNRNVTQGDPAYCFSHPLRQRGYFSAGIINRFYWNSKYNGEDRESIDALRHLRADFSNDWAPGSSGSPLLDRAGNVVAHVSTISTLSRGRNSPVLLTVRTGIPAQSVERLVEVMRDPDEIKRLALLDASPEEAAATGGDGEPKDDEEPEEPEDCGGTIRCAH